MTFLGHIKQCILIAALCVSCCAMNGCLESSFQLAKESRLPKWITIPPGLTRADVTVTMDYYSMPLDGNDAKFTLKDRSGKKLAKLGGKTTDLCPFMPDASQRSRFVYPAYEAITVNGITDIIEHRRMEPIFYLSDDPNIWKVLSDVKLKAIKPKHTLCAD